MNIRTIEITRPRAFNNPPQIGEYTVPVVRDNDRGTVVIAKRADDETATHGFLVSSDEADGDALKAGLDTLKSTIEIATQDIATKAKDVHPHRMAATAFETYVRLCRRSFKDTVGAVRKMNGHAVTGRKEFVDVHVVNQSVAASISGQFALMDQAAILQSIDTMSADQLAVLLTMRGLVDLPDRIWRDVQIRYVVQANLAGERSDGVGIAAKQPSLDDPAAIGLDEALLHEWAEARFKSFEKRIDRADEIAGSLKNMCSVLAVACDKSADEIWSALYD